MYIAPRREIVMRQLIHNVVRDFFVYMSAVVCAPLGALALIMLRATGSDSWFIACGQLLSLAPGSVGVFLRRGYYLMCVDRIARDCGIGFATWLAHPEVRIGLRVSIGDPATINRQRSSTQADGIPQPLG